MAQEIFHDTNQPMYQKTHGTRLTKSPKIMQAILGLGWLVLLPLVLIQMFWSTANPFTSRAEVWKWVFQSLVLVTVITMLVLACLVYAHIV